MDLKNEVGFTALMVKPSTQQFVAEHASTFSMRMYQLVDAAVKEYQANHTRPDCRHVAADSDPIGGRDGTA